VTEKNFRASGIFSAFSSAAEQRPGSEPADARHQATDEGRTVLALEMIADQLALIHGDLCSIDDFARIRNSGEDETAAESVEAGVDSWDNEGGRSAQDTFWYSDITRSVGERFTAGAYNNTDLQHAITEAKRRRRADLATTSGADGGHSNN
jgi:hypothetical protein